MVICGSAKAWIFKKTLTSSILQTFKASFELFSLLSLEIGKCSLSDCHWFLFGQFLAQSDSLHFLKQWNKLSVTELLEGIILTLLSHFSVSKPISSLVLLSFIPVSNSNTRISYASRTLRYLSWFTLCSANQKPKPCPHFRRKRKYNHEKLMR